MNKFRNIHTFRGPVTFAGSVGLNAPLVVNTPMIFKGNSSGAQFFGLTTPVSGAVYAPVSSTVVKSNDWISVSVMSPASYATTSLYPLIVSSVVEGSGFQIHQVTIGAVFPKAEYKLAWEIRRVGS